MAKYRFQVLTNVTQKRMNGRGTIKTAVQRQIRAERNRVVANLILSVAVDIWFALIVQLVVDQNSI